MKINRIAISNIFSFQYKDEFENEDWINFNDGINIIIGYNGSGKSNFLEIINAIFKQVLFYPSRFNQDIIEMNKMDSLQFPLTKTITFINISKFPLQPNNQTKDKPSKVKLEIKLSDDDRNNLKFIQENFEELTEISSKYSGHKPLGPRYFKNGDLTQIKSATFNLILNTEQFELQENLAAKPDLAAFEYLRWFHFLQHIIFAGIIFHAKNWKPLKNPFAIISGYRNYNAIDPIYKFGNETRAVKEEQIRQKLNSESMRTSTNEEPSIFEYVKHTLAYKYEELIREVAEHPQDKSSAKGILRNTVLFKGIDESLKHTINLNVDVKKNSFNQTYVFSFLDKDGRETVNSELSSGEKGILHFAFSLYGNELSDGLFLIDEPELHIHPQMQEKFLRIIREAQENLNLQFILATHSPVFVNEKTIDGVRRFYLDDNRYTKVVVPQIGSKERELIQILNYTNASKIFFSDKVVIVEGDSDEYFFRFYFDKYKEGKQIDKSVDFLYIGGKDKIGYWKPFLDACKIHSYYIGDLDNVLGGASAQIVAKYEQNIFVLKQGNLETYIGKVRANKLENVIDFCKNRYEAWKIDPDNKSKIQELDYIFNQITL